MQKWVWHKKGKGHLYPYPKYLELKILVKMLLRDIYAVPHCI